MGKQVSCLRVETSRYLSSMIEEIKICRKEMNKIITAVIHDCKLQIYC